MNAIKYRVLNGVAWLKRHPVAVLNLAGVVILLLIFIHLMVRPIDVLQDWRIQTTLKEVKGKLPVYHPSETLEFKSTSTKLMSAEGISTRVFDCDAIKMAEAREIQLDQLPANRAPGYNPPRESSVLVPDVVKFNGLPRTCRLVINVCYSDVILWRDHCETAKSNDFIVAEDELDPKKVQEQIDNLNDQIKVLQNKLQSFDGSEPSASSVPVIVDNDSSPTSNGRTDSKPGKSDSTPTPPPAPPPVSSPRQSNLRKVVDAVGGTVTDVLGGVRDVVGGLLN